MAGLEAAQSVYRRRGTATLDDDGAQQRYNVPRTREDSSPGRRSGRGEWALSGPQSVQRGLAEITAKPPILQEEARQRTRVQEDQANTANG